MRDLVYYVATSLDGFIARPDGSFEDFPWNDEFIADLRASYPETFPAPFWTGSAPAAWAQAVTRLPVEAWRKT